MPAATGLNFAAAMASRTVVGRGVGCWAAVAITRLKLALRFQNRQVRCNRGFNKSYKTP